MPNWCENLLIIDGPQLERLWEHFTDGTLDFDKIIPEPQYKFQCPKDCLLDPNDHVMPDDDKPWFNWYKWHCQYWGTKWNLHECMNISLDDLHCDHLELWFDTAWSPPVPVVQALQEIYEDIKFTMRYYEPGCCFAGEVQPDGEDMYVDINDRQWLIDNGFETQEYFDEIDAEENE